VIGTAAFALSVFLAAIGGLELSGFFPSAARPHGLRGAMGTTLIAALAVTSGLLLLAGLWLGAAELPWTVLVIAGGLAVLLAPMGFELIPRRFWDSCAGVAAMTVLTGTAMAFVLLLDR
jgi:hypothetical protein